MLPLRLLLPELESAAANDEKIGSMRFAKAETGGLCAAGIAVDYRIRQAAGTAD